MTITFGPVPSRRLGRSLGINNIPPKSCSYSCLYCQVGATQGRTVVPQTFYQPVEIRKAVEIQLQKVSDANESIDYLTFVPDGEPSLDINLARSIELLRPLGIPIAVISNASLLWREEVRQTLQKADWVSVKVDSVNESVWRRINQPHAELDLPTVLQGIQRFAQDYTGELATETMLLAGVNDDPQSIVEVSDFLSTLSPNTAYLAAPIRPPAQHDVRAPSEAVIVQAYDIMSERVKRVEYLIGYEGDSFAVSGDPKRDLLAITAVHPMREEAVRQFLDKAGCDWSLIQELVTQGEIKQVQFAGHRFYVRAIKLADK